jgi:hypothetical protein
MRVLILLVGVAALLKPTPRAKLEKVEKGFEAVVKASPVLEDLVDPMLKDIRAALDSKEEKQYTAVLAEFPKWQKAMADRQLSITNSGDSERTTLLVAVLQNKQGLPVSEQMDVVKAADFVGLPVVKYIEDHSDSSTPLVNLALKFIDGADAKPVADASKPVEAAQKAADPKSLDGIVQLLKKHQANAEKRVEAINEHEKKLEKVFDNMKKDPQVKFLRKREERKMSKDKAVQESTAKALKGAIKDIENHDAKGLVEAKKALEASMQALQEQSGEFLHFLQVEAPGFSCPYCGAQCIDKCVGTEHKTMSGCLAECLAKNPSTPA